jgi:hypothetical protein
MLAWKREVGLKDRRACDRQRNRRCDRAHPSGRDRHCARWWRFDAQRRQGLVRLANYAVALGRHFARMVNVETVNVPVAARPQSSARRCVMINADANVGQQCRIQ